MFWKQTHDTSEFKKRLIANHMARTQISDHKVQRFDVGFTCFWIGWVCGIATLALVL